MGKVDVQKATADFQDLLTQTDTARNEAKTAKVEAVDARDEARAARDEAQATRDDTVNSIAATGGVDYVVFSTTERDSLSASDDEVALVLNGNTGEFYRWDASGSTWNAVGPTLAEQKYYKVSSISALETEDLPSNAMVFAEGLSGGLFRPESSDPFGEGATASVPDSRDAVQSPDGTWRVREYGPEPKRIPIARTTGKYQGFPQTLCTQRGTLVTGYLQSDGGHTDPSAVHLVRHTVTGATLDETVIDEDPDYRHTVGALEHLGPNSLLMLLRRSDTSTSPSTILRPQFYRSDDYGVTWTQESTLPSTGLAHEVIPSDCVFDTISGTIYAVGALSRENIGICIYKSTDSGSTWSVLHSDIGAAENAAEACLVIADHDSSKNATKAILVARDTESDNPLLFSTSDIESTAPTFDGFINPCPARGEVLRPEVIKDAGEITIIAGDRPEEKYWTMSRSREGLRQSPSNLTEWRYNYPSVTWTAGNTIDAGYADMAWHPKGPFLVYYDKAPSDNKPSIFMEPLRI